MNIAVRSPSTAHAIAAAPQPGAFATRDKTFDPAAALVRATDLVRCLREGSVADDFILDEADAEQLLHYFRKEAKKKGSATDTEFDAVVRFCRDYEQSLDWLFFGDPGVMICGAAAGSRKAIMAAQKRKRNALKGRGPSQFDLYPLPFFDKNAPHATRCWTVAPTGNYSNDCDTGASYAVEFLRSCDGTCGWRSLLACIVMAMIRGAQQSNSAPEQSGIIIGFMSTIGTALNWQNVTPDVANTIALVRVKEKAELAAEYAGLPKSRSRRHRTK
jgi:hypothetical protein